MTNPKNTRRTVLTGLAGTIGGLTLTGNALAAIQTPRAAEGPYYPQPEMRRPDTDNNLVKIAGKIRRAGGEVFTLRGTLRDANGAPLAGHRIEIWQCDLNGNYMHPRDSRSQNFDPAFQGFGHDITDGAGQYVFRTIKPTVYPGRTPHIHVKVLVQGRERLTTQFYIKDHPLNAQDGLFDNMSEQQADAVSMVFTKGHDGEEAVVDMVI